MHYVFAESLLDVRMVIALLGSSRLKAELLLYTDRVSRYRTHPFPIHEDSVCACGPLVRKVLYIATSDKKASSLDHI